MTAVVPDSWGGHQVTHVVAAALADARARASERGAASPHVSEVAVAVLSASGGLANAALTAVGIAPMDLLARWPALGDPVPESGDDMMAALLARADEERQQSNDSAIGTVHLVAALAALPCSHLAPINAAGIDLALLRTGAARSTADVSKGDRSFARQPPPPVLVTPESPEIADLMTRTPRSRSAALKQLLDSLMPTGAQTMSPYGLERVRPYARLSMARQALMAVTLLIALGSEMPWWLYLILVPALSTPTFVPMTVWLVFVAGGALLCPWPVPFALLLTTALGLVASWYELWMKRIDLAEPNTSIRDLRRATQNTAQRLMLRKLGLDDDN